jgi:hypothetical protein
MIESIGPDAWIYGHIHHNAPDFEIGKSRILFNKAHCLLHVFNHKNHNGKRRLYLLQLHHKQHNNQQ